jgi:hypothetical protein
MKTHIPTALKTEHEALHKELRKTVALGGKTGRAAAEVEALLHPHFEKEETYGLPPLGFLPELAKGNITAEMTDAIGLGETLKQDWPHLLAEHRLIDEALQVLVKAAYQEDHPEVIEFAVRLRLHARTEEQVLYPAAMLVSDYLKLKLDRNPQPVAEHVLEYPVS